MENPAKWYKKNENNNSVSCFLCPRNCIIKEGKSGFCGVRKNIDGVLLSLSYGYPVAMNVDPIEKKPLNEFMPGSRTFSIGTYGCNLNCIFCQNSSLSRGCYKDAGMYQQYFSPEKIVETALKYNCESIAFTYNEPTVFAEYAVDIAKIAQKHSLATVLVSNGYIRQAAAEELYPLIDAANIDMKGFSENFYKEMTDASLEPVLKAIKFYDDSGGHLELTNLIIPGKNDDDKMIKSYLNWLDENLSRETVLHFSAYHPSYKYKESPATPKKILLRIKKTANSLGFKHVYLGNVL